MYDELPTLVEDVPIAYVLHQSSGFGTLLVPAGALLAEPIASPTPYVSAGLLYSSEV